MRLSTLAGVFALASVAAVLGQGTFTSPDGIYNAVWTITNGNIQVALTVRANGWVAFGWGASGARPHVQTDMITCIQNGNNFVVDDRYSTQLGQPQVDGAAAALNDATRIAAADNGQITTCTFTKPLSANGENTDITITQGANYLVHWAYGPNDDFSNKHTSPVARGTFNSVLYAAAAGTPTLAPTLAPTPAPVPTSIGALAVGNMRTFTVANGNYVLSWMLTNATTIQFTVDAATNGWVGVGFGLIANGPHVNADFYVCYLNATGSPVVTDRYSTNLGQPQVDLAALNGRQNAVLIDFNRANGRTVCTFQRPLVTGDLNQDVSIPPFGTNTRVHWAYGVTDTFTQHATAARDDLPVDLLAASNDLMTTTGVGSFTADNGNYVITWIPYMINGTIPGIQFNMTARTTGWVAMGLVNRPAANSHTNADMIVGYVANGVGYISDRYSLDFGTPINDTLQNVILVNATEIDGYTSIVFRRPLNASDPLLDLTIPQRGNVIGLNWAYGTQDIIEGNKHANNARGSVLYDILGGQPFVGGSGNFATADNAYTLNWRTSVLLGVPSIEFTMTAQTTGWVSVGFLPTGSVQGAHVGSDIIVGYVAGGVGIVQDRYSVQFGPAPPLDTTNNVNLGPLPASVGRAASAPRIELLQATEANGQTSITFNRALSTGDANQDVVIPDAGTQIQLLIGYGADGDDAFTGKHADNARMRMTLDLLGNNDPTGTGTTAAQGTFTSPTGNYILTYTRINNDQVQFQMSGAGNGWVGFGVSPGNGNGHANADMIYGFVDANGQGQLFDTYSTATAQPPADASQDFTLITAVEANGRTVITFTRPITATEANLDITIPDANVRFVWAVNANDDITQYHGPDPNRGAATANLLRGGNAVVILPRAYSPAGLYAIVLGVILGAYSLLHVTYKYAKILKLAICGASASKDSEFVSSDPEAPVASTTPFNQYYVGSTAVPYEGAPAGGEYGAAGYGGYEGEPSFTPKTTPSAFKSNIEPLLIEEKKVKGSASNYLYSVLHSRVPYSQVTVRDFILLFLFLFLNVGFLFIWNDPFYPYIVTFGYLTVANAFFVSVPATRNSVLVFLMGLPFDHAILFHRFVGQIIFVEATAHYLGYIIPWAQQGIVRQQLMIFKYWVGLIAWIGVAVVYLTSLELIRRKAFNFFFLTHFTFFAFFIAGTYHTPAFLPFAIAAAVVYGIDRILRTFWSSFPVRTTEFRQLPGGLVRVKFPKHCAARYELGQYVFLNFPGIAPLQWHPFTLANGPDEPELEVDIRSLGDHTKKILKIAETGDSVLVRADGPYGEWPFNYARYKKVILVAGGVGVTPCVAALRHIYHINRVNPKAEAVVQEVYFIWSCQNEETFGWFKDILEEVWSKSGRDGFPVFKPYIYITRAETVSDARLIPGRPQLDRVFIDALTSDVMAMRLAVIACGPKGLINDAWDNTTQNTKGSTRIDFHHETFDF